MLGRYCQSSGT
jgi:hypothetical protein